MRRLLLLLAVAGCNQILGIGDVHHGPDAGADAPQAPPNTVVGTSVITYLKLDGTTVMRNEDMSAYTIRAYVPDASPGGFQLVSGTGASDGSFKIEGVPDGVSYMLELTRPGATTPTLYATKQHVIDAGFVTLGRPDAQSTTLTTPVTMNLTGMTAWTDADSLWADSYATGTENALYYNRAPNTTLTNPPSAGAMALTNTSVDWKTGYTYDVNGAPPRLVEGSAGDDYVVTHVTATSSHDDQNNPTTLSRVVDIYQSSNVNMTDGNSASVSGAFTHVPYDRTQNLTVDIAQLRALSSDNKHYAFEYYDCSRLTNFAVAYDGRIGEPAWEVAGVLLPRQTQVSSTGVHYGDPFATSASSLLSCVYNHNRRYRMPGGQLILWISQQSQDLPISDDVVWSPPLGQPSQVTIDGKPFLDGGVIPFDGTAPVDVKWTAVPMAARYTVRAQHMIVIGNTVRAEITMAIETADPEVKMPASAFQKGDFYVIHVAAVWQSDKTAFAAGHIRRSAFPQGFAGVFSGLYRFSADCGNHVVDPGEECDDGGESASCDSDCTMRSCGDGLVNATAGEMCDNAVNSQSCDSDCTPAVCGDGHLNGNHGEQCDDGNLNAGDGCSPQCTTEACGTGYVDAGEQCDDGNATSGDGCSATCQIETGATCNTSVIPTVCTR